MSYLSKIDMNSICLKITGESLMNDKDSLCPEAIQSVVEQIKQITRHKRKLCLVLGGGNIYRGNLGKAQGSDPVLSDQIGMMATVINALALFEALSRNQIPSSIYSSVSINGVVKEFNYTAAKKDFDNLKVVIFCAGLGHPFFTTDTACVLRALEMGVDLLMKGTKVDGIYNKDPLKHSDAIQYGLISYDTVLTNGLNIMDHTAFSLFADKNIPLIVYNFFKKDSLKRILGKEEEGTLVLSHQMIEKLNLKEDRI